MAKSERLELPLLAAAQAQKEITHNEALLLIDGLLHAAAETLTLATPPLQPVSGQSWIVAAGGAGAWQDRDGQLALWTVAGWRFVAPRDGMLVWLHDAQVYAVRRQGAWRADGWPVAALALGARTLLAAPPQTVTAPAGGTVVDGEMRAGFADLLTALRLQGVIV